MTREAPVAMLALASAWLGAALLFAAVVAPAAFAVLPARALAGALVGRVLPALFVAGLGIGAIVAVLELRAPGIAGRWWRLGGGIGMVAACAIAQFLVAPRIARLREAIGPSLEALAPDDARRAAFGRLHAVSVAWLGAAILAAAAVAIASALAARSRA